MSIFDIPRMSDEESKYVIDDQLMILKEGQWHEISNEVRPIYEVLDDLEDCCDACDWEGYGAQWPEPNPSHGRIRGVSLSETEVLTEDWSYV